MSNHALAPGVHRALAPAKINLGLFVGPLRASDGRHELVTVMQSISLADELTLRAAPAGAERDEVVCPGVPGEPRENLAALALRLFRERTGWRGPPLQLTIIKRIPVAAGLGGGSADAAAALRLAARASGLGGPSPHGDASSPQGDGSPQGEQLLLELAAQLGADVPAQISPGRWLATGAGERLAELAPPRVPFGVMVLARENPLSTAAVYAEADRLETGRSLEELCERRQALHAAFEHGEGLPGASERGGALGGAFEHGGALGGAMERGEGLPGTSELLHNDLQRAAVSLCPQIEDALALAREAGALHAVLSGSGPTVLGLFSTPQAARVGAARLAGQKPPPMCATPVDGAFARAVALPVGDAPAGA